MRTSVRTMHWSRGYATRSRPAGRSHSPGSCRWRSTTRTEATTARSASRPGREGDFLTAPEAHPIFGWALARVVADAWRRLDHPAAFTVTEYGSGTGALAVAILQRLAHEEPDLARTLRYEPIEIDPRRIEVLTKRMEAAGFADRLATTDRGAQQAVEGIVLANEVLDALPTHRVAMRRRAPPRDPRRLVRTTRSSMSKDRPRPRHCRTG